MVYYSSDTCESEIPDPSCSDCGVPELGRVRSAGFIKVDFEFDDITDPAEWQQGIEDRDIYVLPNTQGSFDGGAPIIKAGFGNVHERYIASIYKLEITDPNYIENCAFYDAMKRSTNYRPFFVTESQVHISDKVASIVPKAPVDDDDQQEIHWKVECTWISENYPCPSDKPDGIFRCFNLT